MTHSFWAIMGGIAIDPTDSNPFIPHSKRTTLTPKGVSFLLKHEPQLLPDISEEEVKDRRKGSSFTKFVACIQATWFCLSCIARISQKLPISMLELNTFAHAFCTVIVYALVRDSRDQISPMISERKMLILIISSGKNLWISSNHYLFKKTACDDCWHTCGWRVRQVALQTRPVQKNTLRFLAEMIPSSRQS